MLAIFLDSHTSDYDLDDKKQLIWDMATAMNLELRQLAAAGAKVIQIEEPTIHFTAAFHPEETELLDFMVEAFNHEVEGLDDVELWIHTCWGNPTCRRSTAASRTRTRSTSTSTGSRATSGRSR